MEGCVCRSVDASNLRSTVRASRMGRGVDFLKRVLMPGGNVKVDSLLGTVTGTGELSRLFTGSPLAEAAQEGAKVIEGGSLTNFERLCDNAITRYLSAGRRVSFGEHPLLGYLYAKESELTTIRIILTGRMAGLDTELIRERLRDSYA